MANLVYTRVSTDQQSTARQDLVLDEAGIEDPVVFEEGGGTSSRLHPLQRPKFRELLAHARPGDTSTSPRCSASYAAPGTSWTCSTSCTPTASPCASTTARSPPWTSLPATPAPASSCCPP
ncbi:recombinase family protein [Streptomyces sp. NPDC079189]|uniref:recombinase family protein n=1 Tax=Streptomyces sp. NPDC079189 TaxID=3154514 RepID=UPI003418D28F